MIAPRIEPIRTSRTLTQIRALICWLTDCPRIVLPRSPCSTTPLAQRAYLVSTGVDGFMFSSVSVAEIAAGDSGGLRPSKRALGLSWVAASM